MAAVALGRCCRRLLRTGGHGGGGTAPSSSSAGGVRHKSSVQYLSRPDLPKLAYQKVKGKSPGVVYLPGFASTMNGQKAVALEDFCKSLGHSYLRFDYTGCGESEGVFEEGRIGTWKKDVLAVLDELTEGPQVSLASEEGAGAESRRSRMNPARPAPLGGGALARHASCTARCVALGPEARKEIEDKGVWKFPTKHNEEGFYSISLDLIREAEHHCVLQSPIPVTCPVRLIHGMQDPDVSWHTSLQVADRVLSTDVDLILRKHGLHRMSEKEDIKLLTYTLDDLIDKLTTLV
uniref:Abhydrolase domain containing 10, depalmitoylase a n=1 Tax=Lepisosteus oculatus TaxID=7918 RepID=W5MAC0_LEPOC